MPVEYDLRGYKHTARRRYFINDIAFIELIPAKEGEETGYIIELNDTSRFLHRATCAITFDKKYMYIG